MTSNGEIVHQLSRIAAALEELVRVAREQQRAGSRSAHRP